MRLIPASKIPRRQFIETAYSPMMFLERHLADVSAFAKPYTASMFEIRLATAEDAALIGRQRRQMFLDAGQPDDEVMAAMESAFVPWVRDKIAENRYVGFLASDDGVVVGGAGVWLMEFPPHFLDPAPVRAYLLNFYTAPEFRGRGLAKTLLAKCVEEARVRGCEVVTLHASKFGRPIYEKSAFRQTNEMMLLFNPRKGDRTQAVKGPTSQEQDAGHPHP